MNAHLEKHSGSAGAEERKQIQRIEKCVELAANNTSDSNRALQLKDRWQDFTAKFLSAAHIPWEQIGHIIRNRDENQEILAHMQIKPELGYVEGAIPRRQFPYEMMEHCVPGEWPELYLDAGFGYTLRYKGRIISQISFNVDLDEEMIEIDQVQGGVKTDPKSYTARLPDTKEAFESRKVFQSPIRYPDPARPDKEIRDPTYAPEDVLVELVRILARSLSMKAVKIRKGSHNKSSRIKEAAKKGRTPYDVIAKRRRLDTKTYDEYYADFLQEEKSP